MKASDGITGALRHYMAIQRTLNITFQISQKARDAGINF